MAASTANPPHQFPCPGALQTLVPPPGGHFPQMSALAPSRVTCLPGSTLGGSLSPTAVRPFRRPSVALRRPHILCLFCGNSTDIIGFLIFKFVLKLLFRAVLGLQKIQSSHVPLSPPPHFPLPPTFPGH